MAKNYAYKMTRSCSRCGKPMWEDKTAVSAPVCRECRQSTPKRKRDGRVMEARRCELCGSEYRPFRSSKSPRFCSRSCAGRTGARGRRKHLTLEAKAEAARLKSERHDQARRARKYEVAYEYINRRLVFERDGWRCGICGEPVDPDLRWPHMGSATVDHIVPLSLGGTHTYDNTQCAHAYCNIKKGANRTEVGREASC